jgi:hypothetical protein
MILSPLTNYKRSVYPQSDLKWKKEDGMNWNKIKQSTKRRGKRSSDDSVLCTPKYLASLPHPQHLLKRIVLLFFFVERTRSNATASLSV